MAQTDTIDKRQQSHLQNRDSSRTEIFVLGALFLLSAAWIGPRFFPNFNDIGVWDEAVYINSGKQLLHGNWHAGGTKPFVSVLYALSYLFVPNNAFWFMHTAGLGRCILFPLVLVSAWLVARKALPGARPLTFMWLLYVTPIINYLLDNSSAALFAACANFCLWQFLSWVETKDCKHLLYGSVFAGLAALTRSEGMILFAAYAMVTCGLWIRWKKPLALGLAGLFLPFTIMVIGYMCLFGWKEYRERTTGYSYNAFEQGQGWANRDQYDGRGAYVEGKVDAPALYGSEADNHSSVLAAIKKNPRAYGKRVLQTAKHIPVDLLNRYGKGMGLLLFLFAARGIVDCIRSKRYALLCGLAAFASYVVLYLALVYQALHLLMPFAIALTLGTIGIEATLGDLTRPKGKYFWFGTFTLIALATAATSHGSEYFGTAIIALVGLGLAYLIVNNKLDQQVPATAAFVVIAAMFALVRFDYSIPQLPIRHLTGEERAIVFARDHFPKHSNLAAWAPNPAFATDMTHVRVLLSLRNLKTEQEFADWLHSSNVQAIWVDPALCTLEPSLYELVNAARGKHLESIFTDSQAKIEILRAK